MSVRIFLVIFTLCSLAGCGGVLESDADPGADTGGDTDNGVGDTDLDLGVDTNPDPDAEPDVGPDAEPDVEPDAEPDVEPDAELDADPDADPDAEQDADPDSERDTSPDEPPMIRSVESPRANAEYDRAYRIEFIATVGDDRDAPEALVLQWASDIDGNLDMDLDVDPDGRAVGRHLLSTGAHQLTFSAMDSMGQTAERRIAVRVAISAEVFVEGGTFTIGSPPDEGGRDEPWEVPETQAQVTLTRNLFVRRTEVTQAQYENVMGVNPSNHVCPTCPVENVALWDALAYLNRLSEAEGLEACYTCRDGGGTIGPCGEVNFDLEFHGLDCTGHRLPTEAEWEYVARAGTTTPWYSGDRDTLDDIAWYEDNTSSTQPVGTKDANPWGLYDISGNVYEWVWGSIDDYPTDGAVDPVGLWHQLNYWQIIRGGSWRSAWQDTRSAARGAVFDEGADPDFGFRSVRTAP